jgi:hypothetical protein
LRPSGAEDGIIEPRLDAEQNTTNVKTKGKKDPNNPE